MNNNIDNTQNMNNNNTANNLNTTESMNPQPIIIPTVEESAIQPQEIQPQQESQPENIELPKKKRRFGRILVNIITFILFVVILLEAGIGILNMQRINNGEDPIWYLSTSKTETELKTVTEYNLGLYRIVKTDTARETKTTLKPFFLRD